MIPLIVCLSVLGVIILAVLIYCFLTMPRFFNPANMDLLATDYAHRGFHNKNAPENSLAAFSLAVDERFGIETDVQLSADGVIFLFHDEYLKRMCGCDKKLSELTASEIKELRLLDTDEQIPTLDELLDLVDGRVPLLIEVKYYARTAELCSALAERLDSYLGSFAIQSFDPRVLRFFKKKRPRFARGQLVTKSEKTEDNKRSPANNPFLSFGLAHLLFNFLSRPDFISIKTTHSRELGFVLATEVFKAKGLIWTVRNKKQQAFFKRQGYFIIFEGFDPL